MSFSYKSFNRTREEEEMIEPTGREEKDSEKCQTGQLKDKEEREKE